MIAKLQAWAAAVAVAFSFLFAFGWRKKREGAAEERQKAEGISNEAARKALEASRRVDRDAAAGRLLDDDGHRRD